MKQIEILITKQREIKVGMMKQFSLTDNLCFSSGILHQSEFRTFSKIPLAMCLGPMRVCRPKLKQQSLCLRLVVQQPLATTCIRKNAVFILINTSGLVNVKVCLLWLTLA